MGQEVVLTIKEKFNNVNCVKNKIFYLEQKICLENENGSHQVRRYISKNIFGKRLIPRIYMKLSQMNNKEIQPHWKKIKERGREEGIGMSLNRDVTRIMYPNVQQICEKLLNTTGQQRQSKENNKIALLSH